MRRLLLTFAAFFVLTTPADAAWTWPVSGEVITPYRNGTDPYATGQHRGIDIAAPVGAVVRAAAGGDVRFAGTAGSSGLTISIRTADGYDTSYLHLSAVEVRAGAHVSSGDRIGAVGTTGTRSATVPHLHFGVRDAGTRHGYHDPLAFLPPAPPPSPGPGPEPPLPAPVPRPEPSPPAASPAPSPPPTQVPLRVRVPDVTRAPTPHARPHPRYAPDPPPSPHRVPRPLGTPVPSSPRPAPVALPRSRARQSPVPTGLDPLRRAKRVARGVEAEERGPDIGWPLACAGLLLAAAVLGLTEDGRGATTRARSKLLGTLRARQPFARG
jgi:hypothetical protein